MISKGDKMYKKSKAQVSTEYLIVFGIAFLIIATGTFAFMKFSKSGMWTKSQCIISEPELNCEGFVKTYDDICGDTNKDKCVILYIKNNMKETITIAANNIEFEGYSETENSETIINTNEIKPITVSLKTVGATLPAFRPGSKINTDYIITYNVEGSIVPHYVTGYISGRMLPKPPATTP